MDHDFYWLFSRFWWLIFPIFWMTYGLFWGWSRHSRANRSLDIIKSYADQGKDPPPELLKTLQQAPDGWGRCGRWRSPEERLSRAILFAALALVFGFMTFWRFSEDHYGSHHMFGLLVPTAVFAALAFSNFLSLLFISRTLPPPDQDRHNR
jgi:hypothetical protein